MKPFLQSTLASMMLIKVGAVKLRSPTDSQFAGIANIDDSTLGAMVISDMAAKDSIYQENEERRAQEEVQKLTDHYVAEVDSVLAEKEKELLQV